MGRKPAQKTESAILNDKTYMQYYNRLTELAISMFEWKNLPDTIDPRFLELSLYSDGMAVFFEDEVMGHLALQVMIGGNLDVYRVPTIRTAYATNGYNKQLDQNNSIIIFNNYLRTNSMLDIEMYARRLYEAERTIDVNIKQQKTPKLIQCSENQRLVMKNLYMQYDGNEPYIFGDKNLDLSGVKVFDTTAPYIADQLNQYKHEIFNEALTYLGISNVNIQKKERLLSDEVSRNMGSIEAQKYTRLNARKDACAKINKMFNLDIDVEYREDVKIMQEMNDEDESVGDDNE
jgi:hypothetical protein